MTSGRRVRDTAGRQPFVPLDAAEGRRPRCRSLRAASRGGAIISSAACDERPAGCAMNRNEDGIDIGGNPVHARDGVRCRGHGDHQGIMRCMT
ncbi:hypothetical protein OXV27_30795 [Burkholderia contaminans]|uniref:hypothetical protein n=1 Tax=Burkholderia contaminans TaxID=488447 RepID=UPI002D7EA320|nr:hypothetical protein [Burkholderia contaminans]MEB4635224.1 hypothetical protein [Burkholderia contaminans]MEB4665445.1 hypothetical protein [Burkholderia contaminans]MEB4691373.1 hypothetical protein [Burkholderia contaminans]